MPLFLATLFTLETFVNNSKKSIKGYFLITKYLLILGEDIYGYYRLYIIMEYYDNNFDNVGNQMLDHYSVVPV